MESNRPKPEEVVSKLQKNEALIESRDCSAIRVNRKLNSTDVIYALTDLFMFRRARCFIRSYNGLELIAQAVRNHHPMEQGPMMHKQSTWASQMRLLTGQV